MNINIVLLYFLIPFSINSFAQPNTSNMVKVKEVYSFNKIKLFFCSFTKDSTLVNRIFFDRNGNKVKEYYFSKNEEIESIVFHEYDEDNYRIKSVYSNPKGDTLKIIDARKEGIDGLMDVRGRRCGDSYVKCEYNNKNLVIKKIVYDGERMKKIVVQNSYTYQYWDD